MRGLVDVDQADRQGLVIAEAARVGDPDDDVVARRVLEVEAPAVGHH
ncbi:MAG: hypothetical protein L0227_02130 [Chloroflexi bacterium]|nr:hypothetical protein [Chloroflexota bacterium]